jgi:hypothetical protein
MELPIIKKIHIDDEPMYAIGFSEGIIWWGVYPHLIQAILAYIRMTTKYIIRRITW